MMIDMHAHWRPAEVADALRARTREPRIVRNADGVEVLKMPRMGEEPLAKAFDDVDFHLGRMDRQGVEIERAVAARLVLLDRGAAARTCPGRCAGSVNDGLSAICQKHPGRFAAFAALPLTDMSAAAAELERALGAAGHDRRADAGQLLPHAQGRRGDAAAAGSREPPPARCSSSTTARGRATPSPRSAATPTTRAAATARSTCRRACRR